MKPQQSKFLNRFKTVSQYGIGQSIPVVATLLLSYLIVKNHSVSLWGEYVTLLLWVNLIALFAYFGNKNYLLKVFSEQPNKINSLWTSNFLTRTLLVGISILCVWLLPFFESYQWLVMLWILLLFYNQSFEVVLLYHRDFTLNIYVESIRNALVLCVVLFYPNELSVSVLLKIILLGLILKALCYTFFYFKKFSFNKLSLDFKSLRQSVPFFIPMILGTIRTKIDAYYGTLFFTKEQLSAYQILISMIGLVQMGTTYIINPYLKTLYRISKTTRNLLEQKTYLFGGILGVIATGLIYGVIHFVFGFQFSWISYALGFSFIITLLLHLLLINEFYKENKQLWVAIIIAITASIQLILGYFVINTYQEEGALAIKALGQWGMVLALLWLRKKIVKSDTI